MLRKIIVLLLILFVPILCLLSMDPSRKFMMDKFGRRLIFHGVNVVYKLPPYFPITDKFDPMNSFSDEDYQYLKKFGFNLVRLGVSWESVERSEGVYDMAYLDRVEAMITKLGENGISVILDSHQDVFSRLFCGEGCPAFYAKKLPYATTCSTSILSKIFSLIGVCIPFSAYHFNYDADGLPEIEMCKKNSFLKYHQSPEVSTVYEAFYMNVNGIQERYVEFWQTLARKFKGFENIVGYNVWNEPFIGDVFNHPYYAFPGYADNHKILPFYKKMDKAIREINPDYVFMFEPAHFPDTVPIFGGKVLGGFNDSPAAPEYKDKQMLNVHNYCCGASPDACATGEPTMKDAINLCASYHENKVKENMKQAEKLKVPLIITEFGACSESDACKQENLNVVRSADNYLVSWTYWMYKPYRDHTTTANPLSEGIFNENGTPQKNKLLSLTRPYVQAYQGTPIKSHFNDETYEYLTLFKLENGIKEPSLLYLNKEIFYNSGYNVRITKENGEKLEIEITEVDEHHIAFYVISNEKDLIVKVHVTKQ